jgi:hypothetical protein
MSVPAAPKIYHIVHIDRLPSILADGCLWCDAEISRRRPAGTTIGMQEIKQRRLTQLRLTSHPDLFVGDCVPFYFCPRSVMLYLIYRANHPHLTYRGGQGPIIHLEADLRQTVAWAEQHGQRWAFSLSNAGSSYFEDRSSLARLGDINWAAVQTRNWQAAQDRDGKQAEFLMEHHFPWELVTRIGVLSRDVYRQVSASFTSAPHQPRAEIRPDWYY